MTDSPTAPAPRPAPWAGLRTPIITAAICVVVVLIGGLLLRRSSVDLGVVQALNSLHHGAIGAIGDFVYKFVGPVPAVIETAVLTVVIIAVRRELRPAATFAVTVAVTWLSSAAVKIVMGRPRPALSLLANPPAPQGDASYPSGHAVFITALVIAALLVTQSFALRRLWAVLGPLAVLGVAFCLLSDGVHFPTDVLASIIWAIGLAPLVRGLWERFVEPRVPFLRPRVPRHR